MDTLRYRVSHSEECKVNQLWGVETPIILLNHGAQLLQQVWKFEFHEPLFKKETSVGLNSLRQYSHWSILLILPSHWSRAGLGWWSPSSLTTPSCVAARSAPVYHLTIKKKLLFVHPLQDLLQTWSIDSDKLSCTNVSLGKLKRELTTVERDPVRDCVYFGTSSGDIIKVNILTISLN